MKATWNGKIIADSDKTIVIEGNHYFPLNSVDQSMLAKSDLTTDCVWKGRANYYSLAGDDTKANNAAWYYPEPLPEAIDKVGEDFTNYIAFYPNEVEVI